MLPNMLIIIILYAGQSQELSFSLSQLKDYQLRLEAASEYR